MSASGSARGLRSRAAVAALRLTNATSRRLGRGSGTVIGGRAGLLVDPGLLAALARSRRTALVTGTNGKTTTARLLVAAAQLHSGRPVAHNDTGANMPAGHVAALAEQPDAELCVLEVDESYLDQVIQAIAPRVVVLLNLSRDQLDRIAEVRILAERWRRAFAGAKGGGPVVVANADDPMVVWAAEEATDVCWVGAGQVWRDDAVGCPACGGRIHYDESKWACESCPLARPATRADVIGATLRLASGEALAIDLSLPGQFNRANAGMVAVAAPFLVDDGAPGAPSEGAPPDDRAIASALRALGTVTDVAGRFSVVDRHGAQLRLLLAKNPAGWTAIFDLMEEASEPEAPLVLSVNARVADGFDTSWLWDVPFERLSGRTVIATGDRRADLAVRLRYAEVDHEVIADPLGAVDTALGRAECGETIEFLGNYTAFADLRAAL